MVLEKSSLAVQLKQYITIILDEYGHVISEKNVRKIEKMKDNPEACIEWNDTSVISLFVRDNHIYLPLESEKVLSDMSKHDHFGINRNHKSCEVEHYIENDHTFRTYIEHAIVKGLTPMEYFEENLLHEVMHLCGTGGSSSLEEGLTELKTRELAQKYGLLTSGCGYPKEVKIALRLKEILGSDVMDHVTFLGDHMVQIQDYLTEKCGKEMASFYFSVRSKMKEQSYDYRQELENIADPVKKQFVYDKIDYQEVHQKIDQFEMNHVKQQ